VWHFVHTVSTSSELPMTPVGPVVAGGDAGAGVFLDPHAASANESAMQSRTIVVARTTRDIT
jgi:hypothetical protein